MKTVRATMIGVLSFCISFCVFAQSELGTDNNQYVRIAEHFEQLAIKGCEQSIDVPTYHNCSKMVTERLPEGFVVLFAKNENYFSVFVIDKSRNSSFLTILHAPWRIDTKTPVKFYAPEQEVIGKMKQALMLHCDECDFSDETEPEHRFPVVHYDREVGE